MVEQERDVCHMRNTIERERVRVYVNDVCMYVYVCVCMRERERDVKSNEKRFKGTTTYKSNI
jgi:hypothetical protein